MTLIYDIYDYKEAVDNLAATIIVTRIFNIS